MKNQKQLIITMLLFLAAAIALAAWVISIKAKIEGYSQNVARTSHVRERDFTDLYYLQSAIGSGGFVHNLKNYALTNEQRYLDTASDNLATAKLHLMSLTRHAQKHEEASLLLIASTLENYEQSLLNISSRDGSESSALLVQKLIAFDNEPILQALDSLTSRVLSDYRQHNELAEAKLGDVQTQLNFGYAALLPMLLLVLVAISLVKALQKRAQALENSRQNLQTLLDITPDCILSVSQSGIILKANVCAKLFFGYGDELEGMSVEDLMPEGFRAEHRCLRRMFFNSPDNRLMAKGRIVQAHNKFGERKDVSVSLGHAELDGENVAVVSLRDVTEENSNRLQLQDFKQRVELACQAGAMAFWYWDKHRKVIVTDRPTDVWDGNAYREEKTMKQWLEHIHPDDRKTFVDGLTCCERDGETVVLLYRTKNDKDKQRDMRVVMVPQKAPDVADSVFSEAFAIRIVGMVQDVTEQREAEERLQKAMRTAESANLAKSQFLANMSHEIRTPMNAIIGILTLLMDAPLPQKQARMIHSACNAGESLVSIVNDILDFSKLEAGEVRVINEPFKLDEVLDKLVDLYGVVTHSKSITLQLNVRPDVYIDLIGDALRIGQVLGNIVSNAIKFTQAGTVSIDVSFVDASRSACKLRFSIIDTGIGLSDEQIEHVFKPFRQADMSTTREYGGSGLGLSISQRLLRMMGSHIEVRSTKGKGAEFFFEVEFDLQANAKRYSDLVADKKRVLVVIADHDLHHTVVEYFEKWKIKTVSYHSLAQATDSLTQDIQAFDNLLIHLADESDYDQVVNLCRQWRQLHSATQNILTVISAQNYIDDLALINLHATFVTHPPTPSRLFDAINSNGQRPLHASDTNLVQLSREQTKNIVGAKVLLAEDVETNQVVAVDLLETLGLQVDVVSNGAQAVEAVRSNHYDAVLMDFHMPILNGLEATKKIRALKGLEHLPIVAMTAAVFEQDKQAAIDSGMNAHLAKPIQIYQLASVLKEYIPQKDYPGSDKAQPRVASADSKVDLSALHDDIDIEAVKLNFGHNQMVYQNCLRHFSNDFADWVQRIEYEIEQENYAQAAQLAHKLKGAAGNIYATAIYSQSSKLQQALNLGHQGPLKALKGQLNALLNQINTVLHEQDASATVGTIVANGSGNSEFIDCLEQVKTLVMKSRFVEPALLSQFVSNALWVDRVSVEQFKQAVETFNFSQARLLLDKIELAWKIKEEQA